MFSMLNAIGGISNVADFTTPCVNITNSAFTQLTYPNYCIIHLSTFFFAEQTEVCYKIYQDYHRGQQVTITVDYCLIGT